MRIGISTENVDQNVLNWFVSQAEEAEIEFFTIRQPEDLNHAHGLLCLAQDDGDKDWPEKVSRLRVLADRAKLQGIPVIWCVEGDEFEGSHSSITDFREVSDVSVVWTLVLNVQSDFETGRLKVIRETIDTEVDVPDNEDPPAEELVADPIENDPEEEEPSQTADTPSRIIAVGGPRGCGSSFISWNLAALLNAVILEGRSTGTLAKWMDVSIPNTRTAILEAQNSVSDQRFGVTADQPMNARDVDMARMLGGDIVVDVGDCYDDVWINADVRVFVVTPDPQFRNTRIPEGTTVVLNRFPSQFPTNPKDIFKRDIDLVVRDLGSEAFLKLWARKPWILDQTEEERNRWRRIAQ